MKYALCFHAWYHHMLFMWNQLEDFIHSHECEDFRWFSCENHRSWLTGKGSQSRVATVSSSLDNRGTNNSGVNTNRKAAATAGTPSKYDQLERIEHMVLSMKATYDTELKALRQELAQSRGPPMPWMVPNYPWMFPPFEGLTATSFQEQVPMSYSQRLQHSSL